MRITLDTNIVFQALYSNEGASHYILRLVRADKIKLAISVPVFEEYADVLLRPSSMKSFGLDKKEVHDVLDFIALVGEPHDISYLARPNLRDESDNIFVELAIASGSRYLLTKNIRDFTIGRQLKHDNFHLLTPAEFLKQWRKYHE